MLLTTTARAIASTVTQITTFTNVLFLIGTSRSRLVFRL
jgi:hypothetical protein